MNPYALLNIVASLLITISVTGFMLMVMRPNSPVDCMPLYLKWWIRISLIVVATGALFNVLVASIPMWSEILLNVGVASLFTWAFFWHRQRWMDEESGCDLNELAK